MKVDVDQDKLVGIHFQCVNKSGSVLSIGRIIGRISRKQTSNIQWICQTACIQGRPEKRGKEQRSEGENLIFNGDIS